MTDRERRRCRGRNGLIDRPSMLNDHVMAVFWLFRNIHDTKSARFTSEVSCDANKPMKMIAEQENYFIFGKTVKNLVSYGGFLIAGCYCTIQGVPKAREAKLAKLSSFYLIYINDDGMAVLWLFRNIHDTKSARFTFRSFIWRKQANENDRRAGKLFLERMFYFFIGC